MPEHRASSPPTGLVLMAIGALLVGLYFVVASLQGEYGSQSQFKDRLRIQHDISDDDADVYMQRAKLLSIIVGVGCLLVGGNRFRVSLREPADTSADKS